MSTSRCRRGASWRFNLGLAACLAFAATPSLGEAHSPPLDAPPGLSGFELLTLPNGARALVGTPSRTVAATEVLLLAPVGTRLAELDGEVASRALAAAFLDGRLTGESVSIRRQLARMGVVADSTVGREVTVFRFAVPTRWTERFLHLLGTLLRREGLDPRVVEQAIASQAASREAVDPWQRAVATLDQMIWQEAEPAVGLAAGASPSLVPAQLEALRRRAYAPERLVLGVWGALPWDELVAMIRRQLGAPGEQAAPSEALGQAVEPTARPIGGTGCLLDPGADPPVLLMGVGAQLPDDRAFYAWQLATHILGASHSSRLHHRLRVREPFVYTVEASCVPMGSHGLTLRISTQSESLESAREAVSDEVLRLLREEVPQAELDLARAIFKSRLLLDQGSLRDQFFRRGLGLLSARSGRDPAGAMAALEALTPASLLAILRQTLKPEALTTLVVSARQEEVCSRGVR